MCLCGSPQNRMRVKDGVSKLKPRPGAKIMVIAASQLPMLAKMKVFTPGLRYLNGSALILGPALRIPLIEPLFLFFFIVIGSFSESGPNRIPLLVPPWQKTLPVLTNGPALPVTGRNPALSSGMISLAFGSRCILPVFLKNLSVPGTYDIL